MPDPRTLLADGLRFEKAGLTAQALAAYGAARARADTPALRAEANRRLAHAHRIRAEWNEALHAAAEAQQEAAGAGLTAELAEALNAEAAVHQSLGQLEPARTLYRRILELAVPPRIHGVALQNLGGIAARTADLEQAERLFNEALAHFERGGYTWGRAHVLNNRTALLLDRREHAAALAAAREAIAAALEVEDLDLLGVAKLNLAEALGCIGRFDEAEDAASAALGQFEVGGNAWRRLECLRVLGDIALRRGDPEAGRRFFAAALRLAEQMGSAYEMEQLQQRLEDLPTNL